VSADGEDMDARLARLGMATDGLRPGAGFTGRVMAAIGREEPPGLLETLWGSSKRFLPIAALAAACAVVWAAQAQTTVDDALAVTYGSVDLDGE
jgi:hypothetical protein